MKTCLYVGNLPFTCTEETLRDLFGADGRLIESVTIAVDHKTGRSRGFAFVEMGSEEDAAQALEAVRGVELAGRPIKVGTAHREKNASPQTREYEDESRGSSRRFRSGRGRGRR